MINMSSGLYRVYEIKNKGRSNMWSYRVHNKLVKKEIYRKNLLEVKKIAELEGFLWGIVNEEDARRTAQKVGCDVKDLEGRYGIHIGDDEDDV